MSVRKGAVTMAVSLAAFTAPFSQTLYIPMISDMQRQFQTSPFWVNVSISIFTLVLAVMQVVYGPLVDTRGRRRVLLTGAAVYVIGSVGCMFAVEVEMFLAFRVVQALGIAAGSVVAASVIGDLYEGKSQVKAMSVFQMTVSAGFVLGPVLGGFVGGAFGYKGVFAALALFGLTILLLNFTILPETKPIAKGVSRFKLAWFAAIAADRRGQTALTLGFSQYFAFYNVLVFFPVWLSGNYAIDAAVKGLMLLPVTLTLCVGTMLSGYVFRNAAVNKKLAIYAAGLAVCIALFVVSLGGEGFIVPSVSLGLFGLLFGLSLPLHMSILTEAFVSERATAVGTYNFARFGGMGLAPALGTFIYDAGGAFWLFGLSALLVAAAAAGAFSNAFQLFVYKKKLKLHN